MNSRTTIQSSLVYHTVQSLRIHATADEIYEIIARDYPTISKATVYRNLKQLARAGKIREIEIPNGADRFDYCCQEHYHVICQQCGKVFDVDMDTLVDLDKNIKNKHGFDFTGYEIIFKGICPACKREENQ